jgi:hypothetical protein
MPEARKTSIFHNYQRNIIILLKKCCRFGSKSSIDMEYRPIATALWQAFIKIKSSNKRVFHIVFGFAPGSEV